jgi:hypothetical protein
MKTTKTTLSAPTGPSHTDELGWQLYTAQGFTEAVIEAFLIHSAEGGDFYSILENRYGIVVHIRQGDLP